MPKADKLISNKEIFQKNIILKKKVELLKRKPSKKYNRQITSQFTIAVIETRFTSNRVFNIFIRLELNKAKRALLIIYLQN